ncbi:two-component regulator propeller domain-containing protein [Parachryseolinea silvisoli]|uniref:two-component regulator propeller domain-containing protein n=1 Tax=Parachryseolinea silvisoli TaxID=2873601 RepID=UPI002265F18E|nr:two-component regulator propeller domain-containing protein [Parachryseolinea silvisoli]MCD9015539.1 response regulator [Parachryseolinea silvisoli]
MKKLFTFVIFLAAFTQTNAQFYYFRRYQVEQGLSNNTVYACLQDSKGFMWFGTVDGLNRFDGYTFKTFHYDDRDPYSIGSNAVRCLHEDNQGNLWAGTGKGLYRYDAMLERFYPFHTCLGGDVLSINSDADGNLWYICTQNLYRVSRHDGSVTCFEQFRATSIVVTATGDLWVSEATNGLLKYIPATNSFEVHPLGAYPGRAKQDVVIEKIMPLNDDDFIVGSANQGLLLFNTRTGQTTSLQSLLGKVVFVRDILRVTEREYWIATENGIYIYDHALQRVTHLQKEYNDPYSLSDNAVYSLFKDRENGIWAGTFFGGVSYVPATSARFRKYYTRPGANSIQGDAIRELCPDGQGHLWIGTEDAGLNVLDTATGKFTHYAPTPGDTASIGYHNIHGLALEGNHLWIGTFKHGLDVFDLTTRKVVKRYFRTARPGKANSDFIYSLLRTRNGTIYAGTGSGLFALQPPYKGDFVATEWFPYGTLISNLYEDSRGTVWISTFHRGVTGYGRTGDMRVLRHTSAATSLPTSHINCVFEDSHGRFWVATDAGLAHYDLTEDRVVTLYNEHDGMPGNMVFRVLEDNNGRLWASTSKGLACIDPVTRKIQVYTQADGLLSNQFNHNSAYRDDQGVLYFGSVHGLISFRPEDFVQNTYRPPVYITGIQVNNTELPIWKARSPLKKSITYTDEIILNHTQSTFSVDFSALSYEAPQMTRYAYKMEGLDKEWIHLTNNRKVYFTDLSPGEYTFRVRAIADGIPPDNAAGTALHIVIKPPVWASQSAYIVYVLLGASALVFLIIRYQKRTEEKNKARLSFFQNEKDKELYNAKIEFFTNIAHEIKTPLTLISLPLEKILQQPGLDHETKANLKIMEKNTNRLISLSNQLFDFRKTEGNVFSLSFVKTDICSLLSDLLQQFRPAAEERKMILDTRLPNIYFQAYVDPEALKKILSNLFSNAIKYGREQISVSILPFSSYDEHFTIQVTNDGPLIPESQKEKIFEPFFRLPGTQAEGTGIGLALAQSLTRLHKGHLEVSLDSGVNAFMLRLPIRQEKEFQLFDESFEELSATAALEKPAAAEKSGLSTIMLVEDNQEIRDFLVKELSPEYNIATAGNGVEALARLNDTTVQLIISDVMMPVMDGFELCRQIKSRLDHCHIPIILLTAKNTLQSKIEGLEMGADAYIEKPFSQQHLNAQIVSLLKNRDHVKSYFSASPLVNIKTVAYSRTDENFLLRLTDIITRNMGEAEINVEMIAAEVNMSRQTLYRKVRGLTNLTPHELIMVTKLKKAAELLVTGDYKIYEVAEKVGYSVAANFSRDFTKQFGISPSEYMSSRQGAPKGI